VCVPIFHARHLHPRRSIAARGRKGTNGGGHCRQPCVNLVGLHTAAPAAALCAGIAFGDGSPGAAFQPSRITLGLFDPPYLAPLPALGSSGSESRRCGCAGPLPIHGEWRDSAPKPSTGKPRFSSHRAFPAWRCGRPRPVRRRAARSMPLERRCGDKTGSGEMYPGRSAVNEPGEHSGTPPKWWPQLNLTRLR